MGRGKTRRKRPSKMKSCKGKQKYKSKREATSAAIVLNRGTGSRLHAYRCLYCRQKDNARYWHIGH